MTTVRDYTALLSGWYWNPDVKGQPIILSYSFEKVAQPYIDDSEYNQEFISSFQSFSSTDQKVARQALSQYSQNSGIIFVEAPAGTGDLKFAKWDFSRDARTIEYAGFAYFPDRTLDTVEHSSSDSDIAGDIFIDKAEAKGSHFLGLLLHEIGHAVGLKHPFDDDPVLDSTHDNTRFTVMSYTGQLPNKLAPLDVDAIRHIFGTHAAAGSPLLSWSWEAPSRALTQTWDNTASTISGTSQNDHIIAGGGDDVVAGFDGNDNLAGGSGNDVLMGGIGNDVLSPGSGDDVVFGDTDYGTWPWDQNTADYSTSTKAIFVTMGISLNGYDDFVGTAYGDDIGNDKLIRIQNIIGGSGNDVILGDDLSIASRFEGGAGDDVLCGGVGEDWLIGGEGSDTASFSRGVGAQYFEVTVNLATGINAGDASGAHLFSIENLEGSAGGNDKLTGDSGSNRLDGNTGDDILDGGAGADVLIGGGGSDTFLIDNAGDKILESPDDYPNSDFDRVITSVGYGLAAGVSIEKISLADAASMASVNLTGNEFAQQIYANAGANVLDGKGDADTMSGLGGNDTYYVDDAGDIVTEAAGLGTDRVLASTSYLLTAGSAIEFLTTTNAVSTATINLIGNEYAQTIVGNAGANIIDGKAGADTMYGYGGNDTYCVDDAGDQVLETPGFGADKVVSSSNYALAAKTSIEALATTNAAGTAAINLTGNELSQQIIGNAGANVIDGRAGADIMYGYGGNDTYYVDNAGDIVMEAIGAFGADTVLAAVGYALNANSAVEKLTTTDASASTALNLFGNEFAQAIVGNAGANIIDGRAGADTMYGYGGNDTYYVDDAGDIVMEAAGAFGADKVLTSVSYALATGSAIETLSAANGLATTAINLTGNNFAQQIIGNAGANVINGKAGSDTLYGYAGRDAFVFNTTLGSANIDRIADYNVADDTVRLEDAVFIGLATGTLATAAFYVGAAAHDSNDRIIYDSATGALLFDQDGTGGVAARQFAILSANLAMTHSDFVVV